jgi:hypothetical protein
MAKVIAIDLRPEPDEQGRWCILYALMTIDPSLPNGGDVSEIRIPVEATESANATNARIASAVRSHMITLQTQYGLSSSLTLASGSVLGSSYGKII